MSVGLKRGIVKLVKYDPKWADLFDKEKKLFKDTFGDLIISTEHIGSTSIKGMIAKPIIDIDIGVKSLKIALEMKEKFEGIGYEHRVLNPNLVKTKNKKKVEEQELYVKGPESERTHHVHVTVCNGDYWKKDLLFRDYIRNNSKRAKEYAELKKKLAKKFADDRMKYTIGKDSFILKTIEMARD